MTTLCEVLMKGQNALLEWRTGTGKTLSLLVPALPFLKKQREAQDYSTQVIYATRTHSQVDQAVKAA